MKIYVMFLGLCLFFISSNTLYAQYQYPAQYNAYPSAMSGLFGYGVGSAPSTAMLGDAAMINAQANYIIGQSQANINNETAYSMHLNNNILRTQTFFEMRQMNRFYRDLEDWQRQERVRLKRYGLYDREAMEALYAPSNAGRRSLSNDFGSGF